ncbi:hypothetical protein GCM10018789_28990 [Streptomyces werraensis]|nr:hypothetical protein GCM10018789_28990 [Streptomyces werraensis]
MRGRRGSDRVLPGTSARASARASAVPAVRVATSATGAGAPADEADAAAGGANGRARAAAQVTPIEEARIPRMPLSLDIVRQICPSLI